MNTILVTGGCGFIGSHFIKLYLKSHPEVKIINLDKLTYAGRLENVRELEGKPNYEFVQGDICDFPLVSSLLKKAKAVIHFAAETHVDRSIDNPDDFLRTNVLGTRSLLEAAIQNKTERFLHISTDEVYGSLKTGDAKEGDPLKPNSPYSAAKASSDLFVRSYGKTYGLPVIITRSSNNFGPNQFPEKVIPLFITNLTEGKQVPLYGDGQNRRDWIFVEDNCRGVELVFDKGTPGEIYNIGIGKDISNLELTHALLKEMGFGLDKINPVADRPGHDFRYSLDISKIKSLGFSPRWTFEQGLKETVRWYRENENWWKPLKKDKFTVKA